MKPSDVHLAITQSKGKMYEYDIPEEHHIDMNIRPSRLAILAIGLLGNFAYLYSEAAGKSFDTKEEEKLLVFSAQYFDAYINTKLHLEINPYLALLGSASYYLANLPGSSKVLAKSIATPTPSMDAEGLEKLLLCILEEKYDIDLTVTSNTPLKDSALDVYASAVKYFTSGEGKDSLINRCATLQESAYTVGSARQILIADTIRAVVYKKIENSSWKALPEFSGLDKTLWAPIIQKQTFVKELWPAQIKIGNEGTLKGNDAVIQMPTSAGKTKAVEMVIRSAFLSERTSFAVIVAPFRSLCHEIRGDLERAFRGEDVIVDELSDVMQIDFDYLVGDPSNRIAILTPEKFLYILRHSADLASKVGLLILDEAHQFDSGIRGVTYELLLTSLKSLLHPNTQRVLISAVMSNATAIANWFGDETCSVIDGSSLIPTHRSIGFTDWRTSLGSVRYVADDDINDVKFYVPRAIEGKILERLPRERSDFMFPRKDKAESVAVYLGLKLVSKGSIAIFCGKKMEVGTICKYVESLKKHGLDLSAPSEESDSHETTALTHLYKQNFGEDSLYTTCASLSIYTHHGNTPQGIKVAVEYAMQKNLIKFVICTSTLAQGVNFPLRYLIVKSLRQGASSMKVRDFHNLIGRAGRAGMYTEGSILFADPRIYADKDSIRKWRAVENLVDPAQAEPCTSTLLSIFDPLILSATDQSGRNSKVVLNVTKSLLTEFIKKENVQTNLIRRIREHSPNISDSDNYIRSLLSGKIKILSAIESYLMVNLVSDDDDKEEVKIEVGNLVKDTLAYYLAEKEEKKELQQLFIKLATNIAEEVPDLATRKAYGKTLFSLEETEKINSWVTEHIKELVYADQDTLLDTLWPLLKEFVSTKVFRNSTDVDSLKEITQHWLMGASFHALLADLIARDIKYYWGTTATRNYTIGNVIEMYENGFSYEGSLIISAVVEIIELLAIQDDYIIGKLQFFQKRLKYGLPSKKSIAIYELGFSDRVIAQEIETILEGTERWDTKKEIFEKRSEIQALLTMYPAYYRESVLENLLGSMSNS